MTGPAASVLLPTRCPGPGITRVLKAVASQEVPFSFEIVIVDSGSTESELAAMRAFGAQIVQIPAREFGHGRTRNHLAATGRGEVLLFLSQDAEPASSDWMANLVAPLSDSSVAGAYARQLPRADADPLIRYFLAETYGRQPSRRRKLNDNRLHISDMFFSNVSSAIRRDVWQRIPFRANVLMSEDQYWAHDVLHAGYDVVYEPRAQVFHSHNYSLASLFRRNHLSGASLRGLIADAPGGIARRGLRYVAAEAMQLIREGRPDLLAYMLVYESTKALGFGLGMRGY